MLPNVSITGSAAETLVVALAVLFVALAAGAYVMNVRSRSHEQSSKAVSVAQTRLVDAESVSREAAARLEGVTERRESVKAASKKALVEALAVGKRVRPGGKTTMLVQTTPELPPRSIRVPEVVVERVRADSSAIAALSLALAWDDSIVTAQGQRILADSVRHEAARETITALERVQRKPRCGRKCGIALGAVGVAVLGVVVDQARRIVGRG